MKIPKCKRCGKPCQKYGGIVSGYSVQCKACNEHSGVLRRASYARNHPPKSATRASGLSTEASLSHGGEALGARGLRISVSECDALMLALTTYRALLKLPHSRWRVENQHIYCELRDYIAVATGKSAEQVQNEFEASAAIKKATE